jgi:hypothetical protein
MKVQQNYSHGLLYSIEPNDFASLHINDDESKDKFNWEAYDADYANESFAMAFLGFLKTTAINWGLIKLH